MLKPLRPGFGTRLTLLALLAVIDKSFLNLFVDFDRAQTANGGGALIRVGQHWGFRFLVGFAAALVLFGYVRSGRELASVIERAHAAPLRPGWLALHVLLLPVLAALSFSLYRYAWSDVAIALVACAWTAAAVAAAVAALLSMMPLPFWRDMARALGRGWAYAAVVALIAASMIQAMQSLWPATAALTFQLVSHLLSPVIPSLTSDPATLVLRSDRFAIQISDLCSGLEGMGLMLAFCAAWLFYFRAEYRFPQALCLVPLGVFIIFLLNVVRIAALMWIGDAGFAEVAVYGFHSQAGWIAFTSAACALVFFSRRSRWMYRAASDAITDRTAPIAPVMHNATAAYLMPFLAMLAVGLVSHALSGRFETLYPLRLVAAGAMLWIYRRDYAGIERRLSWRGPLTGLAIYAIWMLASRALLPAQEMPHELAAMSAAGRTIWISGRAAAAVLVIPLAEELAYRGYLMRRLTASDFEALPFHAVRWPALIISAVVFALVHGSLFAPALVAGLGFGLLAKRRGLGDAVVAHATTNALLAGTVLGAGQWQLWRD